MPSTPPDDQHPIVREFMAFCADHRRSVERHGGDSYRQTLAAHGVRTEYADPLEVVVQANITGVRERVRIENDPVQAIGDAVLAGILFGIRLGRKGMA